ncbi:copper resistance protein NlpE [Algoriphagus sp. SE2]|uniref:copper resistance protein NlpE n=1 Tax=Algoriphagus sp. SE2 TaxID=3141536 RepID=UPI0031CD4DEA
MKYLKFLLIASFLFSCKQEQAVKVEETTPVEQNPINEEGLPIGDNSKTSLDWNGTYSGIVPCADCEGIETTLTLNDDLTYTIVTNYLGRNDALEETFNGNFRWDDTGSKVILEGVKYAPNQFKVGENRIWQLDKNGEMITGDLADHYVLTKKP